MRYPHPPQLITAKRKVRKDDIVTVLYDNKFYFSGTVLSEPTRGVLRVHNMVFGTLEWNYMTTPGVIISIGTVV